MKKIFGRCYIIFAFSFILILFSVSTTASDSVTVRIFFGLSLPSGNSVSMKEWREFEEKVIVRKFVGFNVVDSTGYYKGKPERSKVVTIVMSKSELHKAKELANVYKEKFKQESVMIVVSSVNEWLFVSGKENG